MSSWSQIDERLDSFEKKLKQQQFLLEINYNWEIRRNAGKISASSVTSVQLGYLSGITSTYQNHINKYL
jgi:hypothetical protein